jgi:dephospho-CoA kinase
MILGLTGGMGGGKSTAARFFEEAGYRRIDSDHIVRAQLLTAPEVIARIGARYPEVIGADGQIVRAVLASRIFGDDAERRWLEDWLLPLVYNEWRARLATDPHGLWVIEAPLLFEKALENWFDFIVCLETSSANQLARLKERGIPPSLAEQRISKQLPLAQKLARADFILSNNGTPAALQSQVIRLVGELARRR